MVESKPQSTPMVTQQVTNRGVKSKLSENSEKEVANIPYREAIGSLLHLARTTRPDISYAVNFLSRKQLNPTEENWLEVKRVFKRNYSDGINL